MNVPTYGCIQVHMVHTLHAFVYRCLYLFAIDYMSVCAVYTSTSCICTLHIITCSSSQLCCMTRVRQQMHCCLPIMHRVTLYYLHERMKRYQSEIKVQSPIACIYFRECRLHPKHCTSFSMYSLAALQSRKYIAEHAYAGYASLCIGRALVPQDGFRKHTKGFHAHVHFCPFKVCFKQGSCCHELASICHTLGLHKLAHLSLLRRVSLLVTLGCYLVLLDVVA